MGRPDAEPPRVSSSTLIPEIMFLGEARPAMTSDGSLGRQLLNAIRTIASIGERYLQCSVAFRL
jgi:hypothetical protein